MTITRGFGWRYDVSTGAVREFYVDGDGNRRWVIGNELCPDQILKGNADLVPAQHQTMEVGNE